MSACEVYVVPAEARFWGLMEPSVAVLSVRNRSPTRISIKVKCSDNVLYRIRPVHGWVEPGKEAAVTISRKPDRTDKTDKVLVQWVRGLLDADTLDAGAEWRGRKAEGQISVPVIPTPFPPQSNIEDYITALGVASPDNHINHD